MSRNIQSPNHSFTEADYILQNTQTGKLIFTGLKNMRWAFLIQNDRLTAAQVLPEIPGKIGAIYIGKVKNVVKNIEACFVEIAEEELVFLPLKETPKAVILNRQADGRILQGDELLVQVTRDAQKTKQASVTANISLSNEAFALSFTKPGIGYSNKLSAGEKAELKAFVAEYELLKCLQDSTNALEMGLVIRTQAAKYTKEELAQAFHKLLTEWVELLQYAPYRTCFSCLKEAPADFEAVFDNLVYPYEYSEIITDDSSLYNKLSEYVKAHFKEHITVRLYEDTGFPLAKLYSLETKLKTALETKVWLKSGGYLVIEPTEALTVIDVNSGKYDAKKTNQDAVWRINKEAAEEVALQLRLRNLSGMIVVDFINMSSKEKQEELLEYLRKLVRKDKQKTVVVDMTALGLVEITRKKEYKTLREQFDNYK